MKESELGRVYTDGDMIFQEGEEGDRMYIVQSGRVRITKKSPAGELPIAILETGEIFGEMALFDRLPRSATATAIGDTRILGIDKKKLFQTIDRDPTIVFRLIESMSTRIRKLDEEFTQVKRKRLGLCIDVEETCNFVIEEARNIISAENGSVMLVDQNKKSLEIRSAFGAIWDPRQVLAIGEGIAGDVINTGKAELVNNVSADPRFKKGRASITSLLCVPLKWRGSAFGVINMSYSSRKLFTIEDLKMLRSLAIYASIAIENARSCSDLMHATEGVFMHVSLLDLQ
jgi:putative methionine-R-sulfoxide reductase with GAF domain